MSSSKPAMRAAPLLVLLLVLVALTQGADRNDQTLTEPQGGATSPANTGNMSRLNAPFSVQTGIPEAVETAHPPISSAGPAIDFGTPTQTTSYPSPTPWTQPTPDATHAAKYQEASDVATILVETRGVLLARGLGLAPVPVSGPQHPGGSGYRIVGESTGYIIEEVLLSSPLRIEPTIWRIVGELPQTVPCREQTCTISKFWRIRFQGVNTYIGAYNRSYPVYIDDQPIGSIQDYKPAGNLILLDPSVLKEGARLGIGPHVLSGYPDAGEIVYLEPIHFVRTPTP